MVHVVMVRHGESRWNKENRFTGWTDVDLTEHGMSEARLSGRLMRALGLEFDIAFTSVLTRAVRTLWLILDEMERMWLPQTTAWQLNERHYGALQGLNKAEIGAKYGVEQLQIWRRSYDVSPPALDVSDARHPRLDARYHKLALEQLPATESLKSTLERVLPYWLSVIAPLVSEGRNVIIAAHGNSIRALCKQVLAIGDKEIPSLEIPTGNPLLFNFDERMNVTACRYLDERRAANLPLK